MSPKINVDPIEFIIKNDFTINGSTISLESGFYYLPLEEGVRLTVSDEIQTNTLLTVSAFLSQIIRWHLTMNCRPIL